MLSGKNCIGLFVCAGVLSTAPAMASVLMVFSDPSGLSAEAEFTLIDPTTLEVRLENTSTGAPGGFSNSDQLLTGLSWDFDPPGAAADTTITGGSVVIGPTSQSDNFETGSYPAGSDVSGEWGYGNGGGSGALFNFITTLAAQSTPFGGANLDGPENLDGPQGGLVADPPVIALGGLGAVRNEVVATLHLSAPLADLDFLEANTVRVEFGSDAAFITVPEAGTLALLSLASLMALRRRRRA